MAVDGTNVSLSSTVNASISAPQTTTTMASSPPPGTSCMDDQRAPSSSGIIPLPNATVVGENAGGNNVNDSRKDNLSSPIPNDASSSSSSSEWRDRMRNSLVKNVRLEHLVAGVSGGVVSTLVCHPLDLIKVRFQVGLGG